MKLERVGLVSHSGDLGCLRLELRDRVGQCVCVCAGKDCSLSVLVSVCVCVVL